MAAAILICSLFVAAGPSAETEVRPIARAQKLADEGQWAEAARVLTPHVDATTAPAGPLVLLARAAFEAGDLRRARLLAERGLLRFPDDLRFRRLDLAVLVARRQWKEAAAAARSLLAERPADAIAWRQLAASVLASDDDVEKRVVLEAAHMAVPDDPVIFGKYVRAQFLAEHYGVAAELVEQALTRTAPLPNDWIRLAVRVAEAAAKPKLGRQWLSRMPPEARDTTLTLLEARLALLDDDERAAEAALGRLIERGDASPTVLVRAAQMAEKRGALGRAEALYAQASQGEGDAARVARLFRARFLAKIGERARAAQIVRAYLAEHPTDAYARQLLQVLK
ncbi:MAG: hypothetical protein AAFN74_11815 [Myxococcota bacterium]